MQHRACKIVSLTPLPFSATFHVRRGKNSGYGVACIAGTRIPVSVVLDNLAARVPEERSHILYGSPSRSSLQLWAGETL
jgi:uncharacterized protein (DUF433 family)